LPSFSLLMCLLHLYKNRQKRVLYSRSSSSSFFPDTHERQLRGNCNGGLFHRQRDSNNVIRPLPEKAVVALRPSSAPQQQLRREELDQWRTSRADQWQRRMNSSEHSSQEEKLFLNGWSNQFLSSQDISLHVVSQV
jgi:hypothetical protein